MLHRVFLFVAGVVLCLSQPGFAQTDTPTATATATVTPSETGTPTVTPTLPPILRYNQPELVVELSSAGYDAFPYLTNDLLEVFFCSDRTGDNEIWSATRESGTAEWNPPFPVVELNSSDGEADPVVSADGLEIFFWSHRGLAPTNSWNRVYRSTRPTRSSAWTIPVMVPELNPPQGQDNYSSPRYLSTDGLRLYTHRRLDAPDFDIYVSGRASVGAAFSGPTPVAGLNTAASESYPSFAGDERTVLFGRNTGIWDVYGARRHGMASPFVVLRKIDELNDPTLGTEPSFVSPDLTRVWLMSARPDGLGSHDIYVANNFTPTPTPTSTNIAAPTVTSTPTVTLTATVTHTWTPTPTWDTSVRPNLWKE